MLFLFSREDPKTDGCLETLSNSDQKLSSNSQSWDSTSRNRRSLNPTQINAPMSAKPTFNFKTQSKSSLTKTHKLKLKSNNNQTRQSHTRDEPNKTTLVINTEPNANKVGNLHLLSTSRAVIFVTSHDCIQTKTHCKCNNNLMLLSIQNLARSFCQNIH